MSRQLLKLSLPKGVLMAYVVGNWSTEPMTSDTASTPKNLAVVDLSFATDYTVTSRGTTEVILANTTGAGLMPPEYLRYGAKRIQDVYKQFDVPESAKCNVREGVRSLIEVKYLLKSTNSVSGEEILLPMRAWLCSDVPVVDMVTPNALFDLYKRAIGAALPTGAVTGKLVTDVARGDLDPTA
jgi:hypothetical protein